ncbi:trichohyalin-like [Penaeus indicus]|uniref:trichohyalin-like n=1 Tax=Penaeus indicus TaxID=29960 RepID=UPI00300C9143
MTDTVIFRSQGEDKPGEIQGQDRSWERQGQGRSCGIQGQDVLGKLENIPERTQEDVCVGGRLQVEERCRRVSRSGRESRPVKEGDSSGDTREESMSEKSYSIKTSIMGETYYEQVVVQRTEVRGDTYLKTAGVKGLDRKLESDQRAYLKDDRRLGPSGDSHRPLKLNTNFPSDVDYAQGLVAPRNKYEFDDDEYPVDNPICFTGMTQNIQQHATPDEAAREEFFHQGHRDVLGGMHEDYFLEEDEGFFCEVEEKCPYDPHYFYSVEETKVICTLGFEGFAFDQANANFGETQGDYVPDQVRDYETSREVPGHTCEGASGGTAFLETERHQREETRLSDFYEDTQEQTRKSHMYLEVQGEYMVEESRGHEWLGQTDEALTEEAHVTMLEVIRKDISARSLDSSRIERLAGDCIQEEAQAKRMLGEAERGTEDSLSAENVSKLGGDQWDNMLEGEQRQEERRKEEERPQFLLEDELVLEEQRQQVELRHQVLGLQEQNLSSCGVMQGRDTPEDSHNTHFFEYVSEDKDLGVYRDMIGTPPEFLAVEDMQRETMLERERLEVEIKRANSSSNSEEVKEYRKLEEEKYVLEEADNLTCEGVRTRIHRDEAELSEEMRDSRELGLVQEDRVLDQAEREEIDVQETQEFIGLEQGRGEMSELREENEDKIAEDQVDVPLAPEQLDHGDLVLGREMDPQMEEERGHYDVLQSDEALEYEGEYSVEEIQEEDIQEAQGDDEIDEPGNCLPDTDEGRHLVYEAHPESTLEPRQGEHFRKETKEIYKPGTDLEGCLVKEVQDEKAAQEEATQNCLLKDAGEGDCLVKETHEEYVTESAEAQYSGQETEEEYALEITQERNLMKENIAMVREECDSVSEEGEYLPDSEQDELPDSAHSKDISKSAQGEYQAEYAQEQNLPVAAHGEDLVERKHVVDEAQGRDLAEAEDLRDETQGKLLADAQEKETSEVEREVLISETPEKPLEKAHENCITDQPKEICTSEIAEENVIAREIQTESISEQAEREYMLEELQKDEGSEVAQRENSSSDEYDVEDLARNETRLLPEVERSVEAQGAEEPKGIHGERDRMLPATEKQEYVDKQNEQKYTNKPTAGLEIHAIGADVTEEMRMSEEMKVEENREVIVRTEGLVEIKDQECENILELEKEGRSREEQSKDEDDERTDESSHRAGEAKDSEHAFEKRDDNISRGLEGVYIVDQYKDKGESEMRENMTKEENKERSQRRPEGEDSVLTAESEGESGAEEGRSYSSEEEGDYGSESEPVEPGSLEGNQNGGEGGCKQEEAVKRESESEEEEGKDVTEETDSSEEGEVDCGSGQHVDVAQLTEEYMEVEGDSRQPTVSEDDTFETGEELSLENRET